MKHTKRFAMTMMVLALAVAICVQAFAVYDTPTFSDVPREFWGYTYIEQAAEKGWVKGMGGGKFEPNGQVTYAQFATMLTQAFFKDEVDAYGVTNPWYARFCNIAGEKGLFDGTFAQDYTAMSNYVNKPLNRYDMAQVVYNMLKAKGIEMTVDMNAAKAATADWNTIPIQYRVAVAVCKGAKIINGMDKQGTFAGGGNMTRAQACVVMVKLDEYIANNAGSQPVDPVDPVDPADPVDPDPVVPGTRSPFAFKSGENVQQMMDRLNKEAPAYKEGYLTNGKPITEANIKKMLDSAKESMPDYTPWGPDSSTHYTTFFFPGYGGTGGCDSFGAGLSDYIFGKDAPVTEHQDFDHIKVGDVIHMKDSSIGYEHTVLVTDVSRLSEGRFTHGDGNVSKMVQWGRGERLDRWSETKLAETYVYTRY